MSNGNSPERLEAEIEQQREQLAATVDQLATKLDVKSKVSAKIASVKDAATDERGKPRPQALAAAGVGVAALVALLVWRARR